MKRKLSQQTFHIFWRSISIHDFGTLNKWYCCHFNHTNLHVIIINCKEICYGGWNGITFVWILQNHPEVKRGTHDMVSQVCIFLWRLKRKLVSGCILWLDPCTWFIIQQLYYARAVVTEVTCFFENVKYWTALQYNYKIT